MEAPATTAGSDRQSVLKINAGTAPTRDTSHVGGQRLSSQLHADVSRCDGIAYFSDDAPNDLIESIKAQGFIQSMLVRPSGEGRYHLVAGERRYRAAVRAGLTELPVQVRELGDRTAFAAATAKTYRWPRKHSWRSAISVSDGDRAEAAKLLGWKRSQVDARLLLLHACDAELDALERRAILLGHAELLATIPKTTQEGMLGKIIADEISVADLKGKIGESTGELVRVRSDTAGFDILSVW